MPAETGLAKVEFHRPREDRPEPYVTPDDAKSCWKKPGPAAGPFQAHLGDGSVVTYYWYRFADQPALLNADLTDEERETLQKRVEKLHRNWKKDRDYLPPPTVGKLADLDPALIVTPPQGLEVGYVPIATRQAAKGIGYAAWKLVERGDQAMTSRFRSPMASTRRPLHKWLVPKQGSSGPARGGCWDERLPCICPDARRNRFTFSMSLSCQVPSKNAFFEP